MHMVKLSELVFDFALYPRHQVDMQHVSEIAEAIRAGVEMPPLIADKKSKRVPDGFHRGRAYGQVGGPDVQVPVIFKSYKNTREMLLDAIRYNAQHGKKLSPFDRAHAMILAEKVGISDAVLAQALSMTKARVVSLREKKTALAPNGKSGTRIALKQTIAHMAGEKLTKGQREANETLGGMNQLFYVNQLIKLAKNNLFDMTNDELLPKLKEQCGAQHSIAKARWAWGTKQIPAAPTSRAVRSIAKVRWTREEKDNSALHGSAQRCAAMPCGAMYSTAKARWAKGGQNTLPSTAGLGVAGHSSPRPTKATAPLGHFQEPFAER
jgi:hypothetical protein